jgi:hypothetical protein
MRTADDIRWRHGRGVVAGILTGRFGRGFRLGNLCGAPTRATATNSIYLLKHHLLEFKDRICNRRGSSWSIILLLTITLDG